jgi:hypothetical protein
MNFIRYFTCLLGSRMADTEPLAVPSKLHLLLLLLLLLLMLVLVLMLPLLLLLLPLATEIIGTINPGLQYAYLCETEPSRFFCSLSRRCSWAIPPTKFYRKRQMALVSDLTLARPDRSAV